MIADNGGADLVYWTGPRAERDKAVRRIRRIASDVPGVLKAWDRRADWLRLGPESGDVVVFCEAGWRFSDPDLYSNPIPGNHGHPATRAIPFFIGGGHPAVTPGRVSSRHARTTDVAPTVGAFFGLQAAARRVRRALAAVGRRARRRDVIRWAADGRPARMTSGGRTGAGVSPWRRRTAGPAPCGPRPGRWWSTSAAGWP